MSLEWPFVSGLKNKDDLSLSEIYMWNCFRLKGFWHSDHSISPLLPPVSSIAWEIHVGLVGYVQMQWKVHLPRCTRLWREKHCYARTETCSLLAMECFGYISWITIYEPESQEKILAAQSCLILCDPMSRLFSLWNSPGKSTGVGSHLLLQGIFPPQESNLCLLHCRQTLYHLSH